MNFYNEKDKNENEIKLISVYIKIIIISLLFLICVIYLTLKMSFEKFSLYRAINIILTTIYVFYLFYTIDFRIKNYKFKIKFLDRILKKEVNIKRYDLIIKRKTITLYQLKFDEYQAKISSQTETIFIESTIVFEKDLNCYELIVSNDGFVVGYNEK